MVDEPTTPADENEDEVVRCDHCGTLVRRKAAENIARSYMGRVFQELWCRLCSGNVDKNTRHALNSAEAKQSQSELGLDE